MWRKKRGEGGKKRPILPVGMTRKECGFQLLLKETRMIELLQGKRCL